MKLHKVKEHALSQLTKKSILQYIKSMKLEQNTKLPREELLAQELGVSRITVRSALNELASEGIIFRRQGRGTFVNTQALHMNVVFNPIGDLRDVIAASGYKVTTEVLDVITRTALSDECAKLQLKSDDNVLIIKRVFYADDTPAIYCLDRIPLKILSNKFHDEDLDTSIYKFFQEKLHRVITWDKIEISTVINQELTEFGDIFKLAIPKAFLNCDIVNFDENDIPVFYANEYVDTDLIRYQLIRQKNLD